MAYHSVAVALNPVLEAARDVCYTTVICYNQVKQK